MIARFPATAPVGEKRKAGPDHPDIYTYSQAQQALGGGGGPSLPSMYQGLESNQAPAWYVQRERDAGLSAIAGAMAASAAVTVGEDGVPVKKKAKVNRMAAGKRWTDSTLEDWDKKDFRIFCGDLGNEVSDEGLARAFSHYPSLQKARVVRETKSGKSKGYGFVSFTDSADFMKAMREMNGKYVGNRPVKLRKSNWKDRDAGKVKAKEKAKAAASHLGDSLSLYASKGVAKFS